MTGFQFTDSQRAAIEAFKKFLKGPEQVFILGGAAGTGKTTVVAEFIRLLKIVHRPFELMAPTGRAAYIIGDKTKNVASTIHRGIYCITSLKSTNPNTEGEYDSDNDGLHVKFSLKNNNSSSDTVYIVDESSMLSDAFSENEAFSFGSGKLLSDLLTYVNGRKLVFVGDYAQLPPVGMNFSPALDADYLSQKFNCDVVEVKLNEVMRQPDGGKILVNADRIRGYIEKKNFIEFSLDCGHDSIAENDNLLAPYFSLSGDKPCTNAAVITYSNRYALRYNQSIRRHYFGDCAPRLQKDDLLMIARNNYAYAEELFNGNIVKVEACQPDNEVEFRTVGVKTSKNNTEYVDLRFRRATIGFRVNDKPRRLNVMILDNSLDDPNGSVGGLLARALIVDFNKRLPEHIKNRLTEIRRLLRTSDALTEDQKNLCNAYLERLQHDPYYNAVICKYGYAMTCHKAQGGEWENVFVDMSRFGGTANENYFRWAYTALTRASKKIWHYRSPDFNYISGLVVEEIKPSREPKVSIFCADADFCSARFARIQELCRKQGVSVEEDTSKQYQHIISFTDTNSNYATFQLWYKSKDYSGKDVLSNSSSDEFASTCRTILDESLIPQAVPFSAPNRPFAEKLVDFVCTQLEETGIKLLNITQEQYQDVFYLKADGIARVGFYYTEKNNYTHMKLISTLGENDAKLQALRQRFI